MTAKLNFRSVLFLLLPALFLTFGCKDMKLDIQDLKDRLDVLEGTTITSINEQISAINTSISDLKEMDESLDTYIKALEATATDLQKQIDDANAEIAKVEAELGEEISVLEQTLLNELNTAKEAIEAELLAINNTLAELKQADEALDKKISDLQAYVDIQLTSITNWANATFSTLAQYEQTQTEISAIKASIEQTNAGMTALETRLNGKIASDIQTAIDALRSELSTDYIARIESAVNTMTQAYTTAISSAKDEITAAYTAAIATAIAESEANMQTWVNTVLTQGYYDIATIDGKLSALAARLDETDADLQKQITEQKNALEASKEELTKAYQNAIKAAIEENNGVINAAIAEAVQNLEDKIQARLTVIDTNISNIQKQLANISKDITSIYEQIAGITSSISDLQDIDKELQSVIDNLESELAGLQEEFESLKPIDEPTRQALLKEIEDLKALIQALQAKDIELQNQITALQTYIDTKLQETADWAEATFATLEQYSAMQAEISAIKTLIDKTKADITEEYTAAIETAISNSETSMKAWVNTLLAQGYYTISDIDGKVSALEALISDGDNNLQNQINEQKAALQQAKADLTNEYKQYINQAIASGGIIAQAIATQVKKAQDELQSKIDAINERLDAFEDRLGKLEEDFVNRIQSLKYIPEYHDRKIKISDFYRTVSIDLLVTPSNLAKTISEAWHLNKHIITSGLSYTNAPETRSGGYFNPLNVVDVKNDTEGILSITLKESPESALSRDFWNGITEGVLYVKVTDNNNDYVSDFISIESYLDDLSTVTDLLKFQNLSPLVNGSYQTANSYIVSEYGFYKFKPCKGNSQAPLTISGDNLNAEVVWESFGTNEQPVIGDLISCARYMDDYIVFRTNYNFKEGNALIAVTDETDNVLWSWHIWLTDQPEQHNYKNGILMDRNLGATSTSPGDICSFGLLYQWGRKDPFLNVSKINGAARAKSTYSWSLGATTQSVEYSIKNPTTMIYGAQYMHGYWHKPLQKDLWGTCKTLYDPCPSGWKVPDGDENSVWEGISTDSDIYIDKTNLGVSVMINASTMAWYPFSGYYDGYGGSAAEYDYAGESGYLWTNLAQAEYENSIKYWSVSASSTYTLSSSYACSVRCQKE